MDVKIVATIIIVVIAIIAIMVLVRVKGLKYCIRELVIEAEKELGSNTGKWKLELVYKLAVEKFPIITVLIPRTLFEKMVDSALIYLAELLKNDSIKNKVYEEVK